MHEMGKDETAGCLCLSNFRVFFFPPVIAAVEIIMVE